MSKGSLNVSLKGADDIFSTEESRQEQQREQVQQIPIGELFPFKDHPFKVLDDESMQRTVESVEQYGVLSPLIARPRPEGGYEIISGHRRQHAAQLAGLDTLPVIVRNMDDDAAVLLMVDSNLQRENILPSERAFAYKMKLEALKNQGARSDLTSPQVAAKFRSDDVVAKDQGISGDTVRRYIRLTSLIPELLDMVDEKKIAFNPAVELSYLDTNQQRDFLEAILSIVIFVIVYGRMIEIYMMVSLAPVPMATWGNHEQSHVGQNYLRSLFALGFQGFLILICVAIYAVLLQNVAISGDAINSIWSIVGYTVLLCFSLFKTSSVAKTLLGAH